MSYASVASHNAPPPSLQPHADPALLNTGTPAHHPPVDSNNQKVNVANQGFKQHPSTQTSELNIPTDAERDRTWDQKRSRKEKAKEELGKAEAEADHLWELAKNQLLRPGVAGGLIGIVNIGLISSIGYQFYARPEIRFDKRILSGTIIGGLLLFGAEGYLADAYSKTEGGRAEEKRAKEEGAAIWRHTKEIVLRPGVLGGIVGLLNLGLLGGLGYSFYANPDLRQDRQFISAATVGTLALFGAEGYVAEKYRK